MSCYMELKNFRYLAWEEHFDLTWYMLQRDSRHRTIALALGLRRSGSVLELLTCLLCIFEELASILTLFASSSIGWEFECLSHSTAGMYSGK